MKFGIIGFLLAIATTASAEVEEISWPQELVADNGAVVIVYQPQIEEFSTNSLEGRAAVSVNPRQPGVHPYSVQSGSRQRLTPTGIPARQ
jgi:hypothetical protein